MPAHQILERAGGIQSTRPPAMSLLACTCSPAHLSNKGPPATHGISEFNHAGRIGPPEQKSPPNSFRPPTCPRPIRVRLSNFLQTKRARTVLDGWMEEEDVCMYVIGSTDNGVAAGGARTSCHPSKAQNTATTMHFCSRQADPPNNASVREGSRTMLVMINGPRQSINS